MTIPVRLPDGTTRPSLSVLAAELGCAYHTVWNLAVRDGDYYDLERLPNPANIGRHGGQVGRRPPRPRTKRPAPLCRDCGRPVSQPGRRCSPCAQQGNTNAKRKR